MANQLDSSKNQTRPKTSVSSTNTYNSKVTAHKSPDESSSPSPTNHTRSNRGVFLDREKDSGDCSTNEATSNVIHKPSKSVPRPRTQSVGRHGHKSDLSLSPRSLANKLISSGSSVSYADTLAGTKQAPGHKEGGGHDDKNRNSRASRSSTRVRTVNSASQGTGASKVETNSAAMKKGNKA